LETDSLNGINEFKIILNNFNVVLPHSKKNITQEKLIEAFTKETDLTKIAKSVVKLKNNKELVKQVFQLPQLSVKNFIEIARAESFRITHLQQIFPKFKEADLDLGYSLYLSLSDNYFIVPANRTFFQGICQTLYNFHTIDIDYSKKHNSNSNKTKSILNNLLVHKKSRFLSKAKNSPIDEFLIGFVQLWNIDSKLTKNNLEPILINKSINDESQESINKNIDISSFGQGIRSLIELDKENYFKIAQDIFNLYFDILKNTTSTLDIRKISYGLERISILESETDQFVYEITDTIIDKCKFEHTRSDFQSGVLPELEKALKGPKGLLLITKIKAL
jgi:hypothetical protein